MTPDIPQTPEARLRKIGVDCQTSLFKTDVP